MRVAVPGDLPYAINRSARLTTDIGTRQPTLLESTSAEVACRLSLLLAIGHYGLAPVSDEPSDDSHLLRGLRTLEGYGVGYHERAACGQAADAWRPSMAEAPVAMICASAVSASVSRFARSSRARSARSWLPLGLRPHKAEAHGVTRAQVGAGGNYFGAGLPSRLGSSARLRVSRFELSSISKRIWAPTIPSCTGRSERRLRLWASSRRRHHLRAC